MANPRGFWTTERVSRLATLASANICGTLIAAEFGCSTQCVIVKAFQLGIPLVKYTPEEQAEFARRARLRSAGKKRRKTQVARQQRIVPEFDPSASKTSKSHRLRYGKLPEMTKNELRAMLTQAVKNTAEASV